MKTKCDRYDGAENARCWKTSEFPSSIRRYAYSYQSEIKYGVFNFYYYWNYDERDYTVDVRLTQGKRERYTDRVCVYVNVNFPENNHVSEFHVVPCGSGNK